MIKLYLDSCQVEVERSTFPGGEEHIAIKAIGLFNNATIYAHIDSSKEFMALLLLTDAIKRLATKEVKISLVLPYLPYARQDRVCASGEAFSLRVVCKLINLQKYVKVYVDDCHSDVGLSLLNNVQSTPQVDCILIHSEEADQLAKTCDFIVAPDAGATKKAEAVAKFFNKPLIQCLKTRVDRNIVLINVVANDLAGKKLLVIDDICDGGGTFLALAHALKSKNPLELNLYVTHGIFSNGKTELYKHYNKVVSAHEWG